MDKNTIVEVARRARAVTQRMANGTVDIDPEDLRGGCAIASYITCKVLNGLGVPAELVAGEYGDAGPHVWVEVGGTIYDPTATQFDQDARVYVTSIHDSSYKSCSDCNPSRKHRGQEVLDLFVSGWDDRQSPLHVGGRPDRAAKRILKALLSKDGH